MLLIILRPRFIRILLGSISEFLIDYAHRAILRVTLRILTQEYWILGGCGHVKVHIRQCVICACQSAKILTQLMEDLSEP